MFVGGICAKVAARPSCGSSFQRISRVQGRLDDAFVYPSGIEIRSDVFQKILAAEPNILEYQVRQRREGVDINMTAEESINLEGLAVTIAEKLQTLGMHNPEVHITQVESIERTWPALKIKRFVPLQS